MIRMLCNVTISGQTFDVGREIDEKELGTPQFIKDLKARGLVEAVTAKPAAPAAAPVPAPVPPAPAAEAAATAETTDKATTGGGGGVDESKPAVAEQE